jgi:hypothetical protein
MNRTLNKFQIGDTVALTGKVVSVFLDEDTQIEYEIKIDNATFYVKEGELREVF